MLCMSPMPINVLALSHLLLSERFGVASEELV